MCTVPTAISLSLRDLLSSDIVRMGEAAWKSHNTVEFTIRPYTMHHVTTLSAKTVDS